MSKTRKKTRQIIRSFEAREMRKRTPAEKTADQMTKWFGSVGFLVGNLIVFGLWILTNSGFFPGVPIFDPYPFVLLITIVSLEAIILTTIVLMSQNRQSHISTLRDELQLQVELIAEREISKALTMLNEMLHKKGVKLTDEELEEMLSAVDTSYIEKKLSQQLGGKKES
ncbi:DUF1003 domain-containing protein [Patescibacteria group bacterium]